MPNQLKVSIGANSDAGVKPLNQDFHGALVPTGMQLSLKGVAVALADGISSSNVSQIASETAITCFFEDYFCTSEAWSVKTAGLKVIESINGWLAAQTLQSEYRFNKDKGYVCTFSALVIKAATAHIFHVGDSRIYLIRKEGVEQLTHDHRSWTADKKSYLSRALGVNYQVDVDYHTQPVKVGDVFLLCTDGIYEYCKTDDILSLLNQYSNDLDSAAQVLTKRALKNGSQDNLTLQFVRVEQVSETQPNILQQQIKQLSIPPLLHARQKFDGFLIHRELHSNSRSHVYLAEDMDEGSHVVIKIPSIDLCCDPAYIERFALEEWVARRISSAHVVKAAEQKRKRNYLYSVMEFIDGCTLQQWLMDNPAPSIDVVRSIIEQIGKGLQALHRKEIMHQDLKPENVMIDTQGTVKLIDFGGVRVAGLRESQPSHAQQSMQGTAMYMAPEYFLGERVSVQSDQFSLAVLAYHMISGRFPYGTNIAKSPTVSSLKRLKYKTVLDDERATPAWIDRVLRKALSLNPYKRYSEVSEFVHELRHPNPKFLYQTRPPLIERNPLLFWKGLSLCLFITVIGLLLYINKVGI